MNTFLPSIDTILPETSSYLATLSLQRTFAPTTVQVPNATIFSYVPSQPIAEYYWNGNVSEEPKELEEVATILVGLKAEKISLGDERVRPARGQKRMFGSDSDDESHGIHEAFSDSDDSMKVNGEWSSQKKKKFSPSASPKAWKSFSPKTSDGEDLKPGSPASSLYDADEITALDGDEQEQIQDSSDETPFQQSYSDFVKVFQENRFRQDDPSSPMKPKRRFHGTPFATIACEFHTQLHARCPPNCPERRPARPHPRSKKVKNGGDFEETKKHETPRSSDTEMPMLPFEEDEDYEESDSKSSIRPSASKKVRSKKVSPSRSAGRTGRKYLPQACDRHKLLHAKCPANCPDRLARDMKMAEQDMMLESDC